MTKRAIRSNPLLSLVPPSPLKKKKKKTTEKALIMPPTSGRPWSNKKRAVRSTMPPPSSSYYEMRLRTGKTAIKSKPTPPSPLSSSASCSFSTSWFRHTQHQGFQDLEINGAYASPRPSTPPVVVYTPNPEIHRNYIYDYEEEDDDDDDDEEMKSTADSRLRPLVFVSSSGGFPLPIY